MCHGASRRAVILGVAVALAAAAAARVRPALATAGADQSGAAGGTSGGRAGVAVGSAGSADGEGAGAASSPVAETPEGRARQAELTALRAEIAGLERRLDQARQRQTGVEGDLAAADLALQLEEKRLAEAVAARDEVAQREAASAAEVGVLERTLAQRRREFQRQLAGLYRLGQQGYLRLLFLLKPGSSLVPSIRLMRFLVRRDREAVDHYQQAKDRLARRRDELAAERLERDSWLGLEQEHRHQLVVARQRKAALLARLQRERSDLVTRAADLADRERKLASFLDLLYGRSTVALAGTPIQQFRGILDWPVQGKVVERFGPRLDPRYHTQVPHNGVDLATAAGAEVKVVYPGKVLFAASFEGYGLTAVVHHPGRVFTLYAGLSELKKAKEDMVSLGETVGLASDRLYFEIRVENHPDDPLSWLH